MAKEKLTKANRSAYMQFLTSAATADCEADVDELLKIFHPAESRSEMGEVFERTLGYNPITHYDMQDIMESLDRSLEFLSSEGRRNVTENKGKFADSAMAIYEANRLRNIDEAVVSALSDVLSDEDANAVSIGLVGEVIPVMDADEDDEALVSDIDGDGDDDELSIGDFDSDLPGLSDDDDDDGLFEGGDDDEEED